MVSDLLQTHLAAVSTRLNRIMKVLTMISTVVLPMSEIGEVAALARRSGRNWFLAILNGPTARTVEAPLNFLGDGVYRAHMVRDDPDPALPDEPPGASDSGSLVPRLPALVPLAATDTSCRPRARASRRAAACSPLPPFASRARS